MSEEFYSIGRGSLNLNGKFYYGLDYAITDFMRNLEKENRHPETNWNELKKWLEDEIQYNENWYNPECKEYIGQLNYPDDTIDGFRYTLDKMTELERGEE